MYTIVSSYLVKPRIVNRRHRWQNTAARYLQLLLQSYPRRTPATIVALAVWAVLCGCSQYLLNGSRLTPQGATASTAQTTTSAGAAPAILAAQVIVQPATAVKTLAAGPTGQLLPPGIMAPYGTYFNTYVKGQCTWYVATRRAVPNGWGNANAWYYHALASGWKVGTTPAVAAIAWTAVGAGGLGHVALVENISADHTAVYISEMNFNGRPGVVNRRWVAASAFKYIY
ncbi:MAG TPA: CHAP domain-containing protein [Candidatus Saccharimonadia bacterium]